MTPVLLALLFAASASASTLTVTGLGFGQSVPMFIDNTTNAEEHAYQIVVSIDGHSTVALCVDLFTNITYASYNTDALPVNTMTWGPRVAWLYDNFGRFAVSNEQAAAVQIAIWDIVHDNGDGFTTGRIQLQASAPLSLRDAATGYITASLGQSSSHAFLYQNYTPGSLAPAQTLIAIANPEPATLGLAGAVLISLGLLRRRRAG